MEVASSNSVKDVERVVLILILMKFLFKKILFYRKDCWKMNLFKPLTKLVYPFQVTKYESEKKCHTVQDKVERKVARQVCNKVPRKECKQVPRTKTEYRPETSCTTVTEQRCTKVSKKSCNYHWFFRCDLIFYDFIINLTIISDYFQ